MICGTHEKLNHISLFMNALSSLLKNSDMCCDKKKNLIWFRKIRYVFVYVKKKNSFWQRKVRSVFIK